MNRDINLEMVQIGMAWHHKQYSKEKKLVEAEETARKEKREMWANKEPEPPREFRKKERERRKSGS